MISRMVHPTVPRSAPHKPSGLPARYVMYGMTTIKAKVIDGFHRELEKGIPTKTGDEVFFKNRVSKSEGLSYTFDENARSIFMQNHREKTGSIAPWCVGLRCGQCTLC